jgi:pimeloyl-ACP methyl ester carboxylesterase
VDRPLDLKRAPRVTAIVETRCGPVEYSEAGAGEPVLYFHGTGVTGDVMQGVEAPLVRDGFRLIVPNRPGYGRTPLASHTSAGDCARVAEALLDSLGIGRISVMGSSGGAAFATAFVANYPARSKALVLLCPQVHRWDDKRWLPANSRWTLPFLKRPWLRGMLLCLYRILLRRMTVSQLLRAETGERYAAVADDAEVQSLGELTLAAMRKTTKHPGFANDFAVFVGEDVLTAAMPIRTPTLILHDVLDPAAPRDHVDWFVTQCPHAEQVCVHTAGHLIWVGPEADRMHQTRVQFLRDHAGRAH